MQKSLQRGQIRLWHTQQVKSLDRSTNREYDDQIHLVQTLPGTRDIVVFLFDCSKNAAASYMSQLREISIKTIEPIGGLVESSPGITKSTGDASTIAINQLGQIVTLEKGVILCLYDSWTTSRF